jgi:hypothetical protein
MKWIKKAEDVTCALLWKEWSTNFPEDRLVLLAKERIKEYTRSDWDMMVKEAHELNAYLAKLIVEKIPVQDPKAEHGFDLFAEHYIKWFFPIDEEYIHKLALETSINKKYALFFEKQAPGLGMYLPRLIVHYAYKLRPINA